MKIAKQSSNFLVISIAILQSVDDCEIIERQKRNYCA